MSETKNSGDKTLTVAPKTLSLKRPVEQGVVRQSFSHGRTKAVVVETVKRRTIGPGAAPAAPLDASYKPETINAFELGAKIQYLNHRARTNVSLFYYDLKNLQIAQ